MNSKNARGASQLTLHQGSTALVTEGDGQICSTSRNGLYFLDTRLIDSWQIRINGERWELVGAAVIAHHAARIHLTNRAVATASGVIPSHTLALQLGRSIDGGLHEDLDIINYGREEVQFHLDIAISSDFADLFEARDGNVRCRGEITTEWSDDPPQWRMIYRNRDFSREIVAQIKCSDARAGSSNGRISFPILLAPKARWHCCLLYELGDGRARLLAPSCCIADSPRSEAGQKLEQWRRSVLKLEADDEDFCGFFRQAVDDVAALRLPIEPDRPLEFVPGAGVPWFLTLFGRDTLITALQTAIVHPTFACASLDALASLQAKERDDYRDAEPGKIMHELRVGELAHFNLVPHTPYYGSADATLLYLITLHAAWRCTGDRGLIERHLATAEACLDWIDHYGDRDGDGFQEYEKRLPTGYENQSWKDTKEAIVGPDGSLVKGPKALCELQGYAYDAWQRMAEIFAALGRAERAAELRGKAKALFARFNEIFWDDSSGFYALCLDGDKRRVMTVASNIGHCLWSGLVPQDRAARIVSRLMQQDMWGGWGVRTLSSGNPAYNPFAYHTGAVWPHDNSLIAMGFRRYGFVTEAARVACVIGRAARFFSYQMPELYSGIEREPSSFPVPYPGANAPQAWGAGSAFALVQALLGFQPDAPGGKLYLDPALPDWLTSITLKDLRLGQQSFDIRLWRDDGENRWEVLKGDPHAVVRRSYASGPEAR